MNTEKNDRILAIFLRGMRGEKLTVSSLANEYGVSPKSISRDISGIRCFLAENREICGHAELVYSRSDKCYIMRFDDFLRDSELLAVIKVLIGSRAFSKTELLEITGKLRRFTSTRDKALLDSLIAKEKYHYTEVRHDCSEGVVEARRGYPQPHGDNDNLLQDEPRPGDAHTAPGVADVQRVLLLSDSLPRVGYRAHAGVFPGGQDSVRGGAPHAFRT